MKVFYEYFLLCVGVYVEVMNGGYLVVNVNVIVYVYYEDRKVVVILFRDFGGGKFFLCCVFWDICYKFKMLLNCLIYVVILYLYV